MRITNRARLTAGILLALTATPLLVTTAHATPSDRSPLLDGYLAAQPTASIAGTLIENGEVTQFIGHGGADENTRFRIASMSKSFTAATVAVLAERDLIDLDAPLTTYLPDFTLADDRADLVTPRMLLAHTSGLDGAGYQEFDIPPPTDGDDLLARLRTATLSRDPGAGYEYFNTNYALAAVLVERVTGQPFDDVLRTELSEPLHMDDTTSTVSCDAAVPGLRSGHAVVLGQPLAMPEPAGFCLGSGGVVSTAADLATWLHFHTSGGVAPDGTQLLTAETITELLSAQPGTDAAQGGWYGMGWQAAALPDGAPLVGHGGALATWASHMTMLMDAAGRPTGVAAVVLSDTASAPVLLADALVATASGHPTQPFGSDGRLTLDLVLLAATLLTVALGVIGVLRARTWPRRRRGRVGRVAGLTWPLVLVIAGCALVPLLANVAFALSINPLGAWAMGIAMVPLAAALGIAMALVGVAVAGARIIAVTRRSPRMTIG